MKLIQLAAPSSNSGKTISTMVLGRLLRNMGLDVRSFKCGPDYIDSRMLARAFKSPQSNIDIHLMGYDGIRTALALNKGDYGILEGAMGYFDGMGRGYDYSAYDIARSLDINTILVYQQKGEMFSMIPKIKGMLDFSQGRIKGIIFSNMRPMMYSYVKAMVEENLDIGVLGYIRPDPDLRVSSKKLGLDSEFTTDLDLILDRAAEDAKKSLDLEGILDLMREVEIEDLPDIERSNIRVALARDQAFSFHYGENQRLLERHFDLTYFSPLNDRDLPDADLLILPGGYIEDFLEELSANVQMMESIRKYHRSGGPIIAESGALLYLCKETLGVDMVGILNARGIMNERLQNFGYVNVSLEEDTILGPKGTMFPAHEYHYSSLDIQDQPMMDIRKASGRRQWKDGYKVGDSVFSYQHINLAGNQAIIENIKRHIKEKKCI